MDEIIRATRDCPSGALSYALGGTEARADVDGHGQRPPAIEITADGPYRVTGGIPLEGADGKRVRHAHGASAEHYALCRCGHSRNKPFCSGMHWYVGFTDPPRRPSPTLFEHAGGLGPLTRAARLLHEKHIPADPLLAPVFADMPVTSRRPWPGGWPPPSAAPARHGAGRLPGHPARRRPRHPVGSRTRCCHPPGSRSPPSSGRAGRPWPAGPPMRPGCPRPGVPVRARLLPGVDLPGAGPVTVRRRSGAGTGLGLGAGRPPAPGKKEDPGAAAAQPVRLPAPGEPVSFGTHIRPLFRDRDRQSMSFAFDLWSADDVRAHAAGILQRLQDGTMPCDGAWPADQIAVFQRWTESGMPS